MGDFLKELLDMADKAGSATAGMDTENNRGTPGRRRLTLRFASEEQRRTAAARIIETGLLSVRVSAADLEDQDD